MMMNKRNPDLPKSIYIIVLLICMTCFISEQSRARQFRLLTPIASPGKSVQNIPEGASPVQSVLPVSRETVEPLIRKVLEQWNTGDMAETLSDQFHDKSRLLDTVDSVVPRDAKLRIQAIRGIQTLQQYIKPDPNSDRGTMVSIVSATVQTQLEFNSPSSGFVRLPGTNEFILEISAAAPP